MSGKLKNRISKPTRISITPSVNTTHVFGQGKHTKSILDYSEAVIEEEDDCDPSQGEMLTVFRRRSKTEPAMVLSKLQTQNKGKGKTTNEQCNTIDSKPINDRFSSGVVSSFGTFPGEVESVILAGTLGSIASFSGSRLFSSVVDDAEKVDVDIFNNFDFPITNLVFEGGGNKGMAYVGAIQVLEEAGIMKKVKRVAGSSVGAITATLVAVGFTSQDLKEFMDQDLRKVLVDHRCGYCSLLPNLLQGFGWNPGKRLFKWFGEQVKERTGNADITFKELLQQFGKELCIVVTNLSQMSTDYFHPKTTPNIPIRTAVRMSTAMPGVFQSVRHRVHETTDLFVDGGLLCNYPIHAFDGWWLSMEPENSFFKKLQPLEDFPRLFSKGERFGKWNDKTLGIILYSHTETELMKTILKARQGSNPPKQPNTKLYRFVLKCFYAFFRL